MRNFVAVLLLGGSLLPLAACGDDDGGANPACDLAAPECPADQVCLAQPQGAPICEATCDPTDPAACGEAEACDRLETGEAACFAPVLLRGNVFDLSDAASVEGAHVLAVAATGEAVTDVAVTDAEGSFELRVPVTRDATGVPVDGIFTFRVAAADYQPYPFGIRPAIPVDASTAAKQTDGTYVLSNPTTEIGLIPLPEEQQGLGSIAGTVVADRPGSTLVVAECGEPPCPLAFADLSGDYQIFNVPDGTYTVKGYKAGLQLETQPATITGGNDLVDVDLTTTLGPTSTLSGNLQIVNPGDGNATSVVLIPESAFHQISDSYLRGEVPPGLRDPAPGTLPDVTGAFVIEGIPDGVYVVLAAFENDFLVRDPDPAIAGTQIVHITLPDGTSGNTVSLPESFKVTGALTMYGPGATGPEEVDPETVSFSWKDDSSEDQYILSVYDAYGELVWEDHAIPGFSGADPDIAYAGPALEPGMYYQWRAVSLRAGAPKSTTEDLLGVFFVAPAVN
jgi:hypothetical protein